MRVYEIAKELNIPAKVLVAKIRALGLPVNNHMSSLDIDDVNRVKKSIERDRVDETVTKRLSSTVLRRRSKGEGVAVRRKPGDEAEPTAAPEPPREAAPVVRRPAATAAKRDEEAPAKPAAVARRAKPVEPEPPKREAAPVTEAAPVEVAPVAVAKPVETPSAPEPAPKPEIEKRAPEPVSEPVSAAPEPAVVVAERAPEQPVSEPAPAPAEVAPTPEPVAPEPPVVKMEPVDVADPNRRSAKAPMLIVGPAVVRMPGQPEPTPPPAAEPVAPAAPPMQRRVEVEVKPAQPRAERRRPTEAKPKRVSTQDITQNARSRFEEELERARQRVSQREEQERRKRQVEDTKQPLAAGQRDPNRPAVGTVISLPVPRIKITERAPTPAQQLPGHGQVRGRFAQQRTQRTPGGGRKGGRDFGRKRLPLKRGGGKSTQITTPAEHKRIIRMEDTIVIPELAKAMGVKAQEVLKKLWGMGMVGVNINASIDFDTAQILATEFGYEVHNVAFKEAEAFVRAEDTDEELVQRAPVVTVMGHVDHGKTSLLDHIRQSRVAAGEAGGITQHVAAYKVSAGDDFGEVVFLDTPGHEAFTEMRARGAQATDIVVLVVAANDGVMPQTVEAVNHARDARVPIIVAVNKCDLPDAQPERVRQQLAEHALIPEEWGGDTLYVDVSAVKGEGIPELLETIALSSDMLDLRANPNKSARGIVIEAKLDRSRGPMATVLLQEGTLHTGDTVVAGRYYGKVRAMLDDLGKPIKEAGPSTPIELLGLDGVPDAGEILNVADDEKVAKQVVEHRRQAHRKRELASTGKISLENLMERIQEGETHELKIVLKADVQGSSEALKASLIKQSTEKVKVHVISAGVGGITESDVNLAKAGGAIIIGFHVRTAGKAGKLADREGVDIKIYDVIYEALDDVRKAMAGLLEPIKRESGVGKAEVRETYTIPKVGTVAGCMVTDGKVLRRSLLRVIRDAVQIYEGRVGSLRRFKEDVAEVRQGFECGLMVQGFNDLKVGDIIESYEIIEEAAQL